MANKKKSGILLTDTELRRRYPTSGFASSICLEPEDRIWLPSRNLAINWQLGGGIPYGKILEGFGEESVGKSLLAMDFGVVTQALNGIVLWQDAEASFDGFWAKSHGLDLERTVLLPEENIIEKISDWQADQIMYWRSVLTDNEPILLVVDSTAALETWDNMEASDSESGEDMGKRSKAIYRLVRKRNRFYSKYGVCVIYINQLRKKVRATQWEDPDTTPGGNAMKYFASQRLGLYKSKTLYDTVNGEFKKGAPPIGAEISIRTKKNKVAPPRSTIRARVFFEEFNGNFGFDKYHWLDEILLTERTVKKSGNSIMFRKEKVAKGRDDFMEVIRNDNDLRLKFIKKAGINSLSQTREKIARIEGNLYKVNRNKREDNEG